MTTPTPRRAARAVRAVAPALLGALLLTGCTAQGLLEDGEEPGPELGVLEAWLLFAGVPLLILVLTALPVFAAAKRRSRYRPSQGWEHQPMWFGGPDDPESAVGSAPAQQSGRGGASASW